MGGIILALTRGSADFFRVDDAGIAVIRDIAFAPTDEEAAVAAPVLGPGCASRLLVGSDRAIAVGAF